MPHWLSQRLAASRLWPSLHCRKPLSLHLPGSEPQVVSSRPGVPGGPCRVISLGSVTGAWSTLVPVDYGFVRRRNVTFCFAFDAAGISLSGEKNLCVASNDKASSVTSHSHPFGIICVIFTQMKYLTPPCSHHRPLPSCWARRRGVLWVERRGHGKHFYQAVVFSSHSQFDDRCEILSGHIPRLPPNQY